MTAKQKAARANFKKAVTEAQKLRKSNPKLTQAQALKQAFAANKKVGAVKKKSAPKKKAAPKKAAPKKAELKKAALKKAAPKKKAALKKIASKRITDIHKDSKSHNVNIRVVSGIDKVKNDTINKYKEVLKDIKYYEDAIKRIKDGLPGMISVEKVRAKFVLKRFTAIKNELKIHSKELKKLI